MKVIYIADDGKEFDNKFDCEDYEWKLAHPYLNDICIYGKYNKKIYDIFSLDTYNAVKKVVVTNENALSDLKELAEYCGFICYEDIVECGKWIFDEDKEAFVKR